MSIACQYFQEEDEYEKGQKFMVSILNWIVKERPYRQEIKFEFELISHTIFLKMKKDCVLEISDGTQIHAIECDSLQIATLIYDLKLSHHED